MLSVSKIVILIKKMLKFNFHYNNCNKWKRAEIINSFFRQFTSEADV